MTMSATTTAAPETRRDDFPAPAGFFLGMAPVVIVLHTPTSAWCDRLRTLLADRPGAVVLCDVEQLSGRAAEVLDVLCRLRRTAADCGSRLLLRGADPALLALLELFGLAELLQPEEPEQAGVEKHVQGGDLPVPRLEDVDGPGFE
jgi:ABC-type transporter Mla MlaB component